MREHMLQIIVKGKYPFQKIVFMKLIKYFLSIIVLVVFNLHANGQNALVTGTVYDLQSQQVLEGASIETPDGKLVVLSDPQGHFSINPSSGQGLLRISLEGYKEQLVHYKEEGQLNIQLAPSIVSLSAVRVTAYGGNKSNRETAGAVALLTGDQIRQGSGVSLQTSFNSVPGVQMDQSTFSEARISIRGNGVRSSYGIRNVKIYLNDIPLTEPDGTTRIEALDVNGIGQAQIIKGPASSIYGGGTGGVINFKLQRSPYQERSVELSSLFGSDGLARLAATYRSGGDRVNSYASYGWQQFDGYRQHNNDMRRFLTGNFQFFPSNKHIVTLLLSRTTQHTQIPGALTQTQVQENRKQASPSNLDKQAGRYQNWTRIGIGQQYRFNNQLTNSSSVFTYFYDLDHPLAFAYLRTYYQSYGGRTKFHYDPNFSVLPTVFTIGAEFNQANAKGTRYVNNQGVEGAINNNTDTENTVYSLFYQSETSLGANTNLALGLSYNGLTYDATDYLHPEKSGVKKFKAQASPRIALSHHFSEALSLHGSVSSGFSPPSGSEISNVDGSINVDLQAEKAVNYEINAKGELLKSRLSYDLALFKMDMKGELIAQSIEQGITVYHNAGRTSHNGAELALSYLALHQDDGKVITLLRPFAALTYSDFEFQDYKVLDSEGNVEVAFDGNELTGIAPWVVNLGLNMESKYGLYFSGNYFFSDRLPLNDANSDYNPSYQVLNAKIGLRRNFAKSLVIDFYAGVNNLSDEHYSSMNALNAVAYGGGQAAYFNPSPERNYYVGLNLKYLFNL